MQVLRPVRQAQGRLSLRFAQDDKFLVEGEQQVSPLRFASVEMTILGIQQCRWRLCSAGSFGALVVRVRWRFRYAGDWLCWWLRSLVVRG
jgi:hypothetical protein